MYDVSQYRDMILDGPRTTAYVRALRQVVTPGAVVMDIGTGVGYFAIQACLAGAARVYAIEPNPAIRLGPELAARNGFADRITFVQDLSTRVSLEPADVIVSDLRGAIPLYADHLRTIVDARTRLLKPRGVLIPRRDTLYAALTAWAGPPMPPPADDVPAIDLAPVDRIAANKVLYDRVSAERVMSGAEPWFTLDYRTLTSFDADGTIALTADRAGAADGICVWFEAELHDGCGYSCAPDAEKGIYGHAFLPIEPTISLDRGDTVEIRLRAVWAGGDYVWQWEARVASGRGRGTELSRTTLNSLALDPQAVHRRGDRFVPRLGRPGQAEAWILARMTGGESLGAIAREAANAFPDVFADTQQALIRAADLSERLSA